jgi:radical SAM protein with 4Fe4S-binding SPASM domain
MKNNPLFIVFEVTTDCNLNCCYCYNYWKCNDSIEKLNSYKKAKKVLKHLFKTTDIKHITFSGGEPFLSERFLELVLFCRVNNKRVSVISNGNWGKIDDYSNLIKLGVKLFQFPFLSQNPIIHDSLTRVKGSWDKSLMSITEVISLGGIVVPVIVLTRMNCDEIEETLTFLNNLGLDEIMFNRFNIGGEGIKRKDLSLCKDEMEKAFGIANKIADKFKIRITSNVCTPHCYLNPKSFPNISFVNCSQDLTHRPITLNINGDVRLCNHSPIIAGNIFKNSINEILESDYSKSWSLIKPDYCCDCHLYEECLGGCRAASEQMGLTLNHVDPILDNFK